MSNEPKNLKMVFDEEFRNLKVDKRLAKTLYDFQLSYVNCNEQHLNFFGGHLLGVQTVYFRDSVVNEFFEKILGVDQDVLSKRIANEVPAINQDFKISSDTFNITCMYVIHRFMIEKSLDDKTKYIGMYNTALMFFYRCISALMCHYFNRGPADPATAEAAFARLNKKFLIKKLGSWAALMDFRAKDLLDNTSLHIKYLKSFNDDYAIVYAINNSQGAIRSIMKPYYREFKYVHDQGIRIGSTSATMTDAEGKEVVKEKTKGLDSKIPVFLNMVSDKNAFINHELIAVIRDINKNTSVTAIETVLLWLSDNIIDPNQTVLVTTFIKDVLIYSQSLITTKIEGVNPRDFANILMKLKNLYLSTRIDDSYIESIRKNGEEVILRSFKRTNVNRSLILSTRTSVILYITLRNLVDNK